MTDFGSWFVRLTNCTQGPHGWQEELASNPACQDQLIRIPTGMGKTAGTVAAWAWNRLVQGNDAWPRRLIFCLPMRVLVEQTTGEIRGWLNRIGRLWDGQESHGDKVGVHLLMGGTATDDWALWPEHPAILIGTQDMLLSRALNRGYAAFRGRWPMEFGLLNQDALWVMDEIQLMDVGLATSAQLQAFRHEDSQQGKQIRPCRTWWMSATLQPSWLRSVDTAAFLEALPPVVSIPASKQNGGLWEIRKNCTISKAESASDIAKVAAERHKPGSLTLVVVNKVETARDVHSALKGIMDSQAPELRLVHSRFRPAERANWREGFLNRSAPIPMAGRIIVATQVVEAGVDISAQTLVTELAPWSSLVQRFGRCARYEGQTGEVVVVDRGWGKKDEKQALPYELEQLTCSREALDHLSDVSPRSLESYETQLPEDKRQALYPYQPRQLILRRDWEDLFDTSPDLSGADLDISRFIRTGEDMDCLVFWREVPPNGPSRDWQANRAELCPTSFLKVRDWLCGEEKGDKKALPLKSKMRAWVWDWVDGEWKKTQRKNLSPGRIVLVDSSCGGYSAAGGWDPALREPVLPVVSEAPSSQERTDVADEQEGLSEADQWKTIATHGMETAGLARQLALVLAPNLADLFETAGLWHDVGKAHRSFQGSMRLESRPKRQDLAKAPVAAWKRKNLYCSNGTPEDHRAGLRHELASALALFSTLLGAKPEHSAFSPRPSDLLGSPTESSDSKPPTSHPWVARLTSLDQEAFNLLAYLVAAHHGKVRMSIQAGPKDQDYRDTDGRGMPIRGVRNDDELTEIQAKEGDVLVPQSTLNLEPAHLGLSEQTGPSWTERALALLATWGPGPLAFLEALIRAADIRASKLSTQDPFVKEVV